VIEYVESSAEELRNALKLADAGTVAIIVEYLKKDTFELVKNLASVTNSENAATIIAYRDGAISRNDALIKTLGQVKKETFTNLKTGKMERIKRRNASS
jgi:hypothetical protein